MMPALLRSLTLFVLCAALIAGCTPGPSPTSTGPVVSQPPGVLSFEGTPDDVSPTWAQGLDPHSEYGLHRRKGVEPVLKPETRVLTAAEADSIDSIHLLNEHECVSDADRHPMCRFELRFASLPSGVVVGSVLNSGVTKHTPNGLLVKVTAIEGTTVMATQASLLDALVQGEFWVEQAFDGSKLRAKPTLAPGVKVLPRKRGLRKTGGALPAFDELSLPGTLSVQVEPVDGVTVTGTLDFGAGCGLDGGVAWMEISCRAWEEASLTVHSDSAGPKSTSRYVLGYFPLAAVPIPIGPLVLVVVVDILVTIDLSGQVTVGLHYKGTERAEVHGGLSFSLTGGLDHDGGVKVTGSGSAKKLTGDASADALGRAELRLSLYGVLGISIGGEAQAILAGGPSQNPAWRVSGNAGIFVKMFLGILGFELSAWIRYRLKQPFQIGSSESFNWPPVVSVISPTEGQVLVKGGLLPVLKATATDETDGPVPITWRDETDQATAGGANPVLPFKALGKHTLVVSATDSDGKSASQTIHVVVKAPSLELSLVPRGPGGEPLPLPPAAPAGSVVLVDAVAKSSALTTPSCAGLVWSASNATVQTDGSCRASVTLGQVGSATIRATLTDSFGTPASAAAALAVTEPPVVVKPQFLGIDAVANGNHLTSPALLQGSQAVSLAVRYLNADQTGVPVSYRWSYRHGSDPAVQLSGPAGETTASTRTFTPPSPWGYQATFTVVIRNATSTEVLSTRTFVITWQSNPK